jgi:hypothetical protein
MYAIGTTFVAEDGIIRSGELINPNKIVDQMVEVEFFGDNMLDVMCEHGNGEANIFRVHISQVSRLFPCDGLPLLPVKRDLSIFDQDAES